MNCDKNGELCEDEFEVKNIPSVVGFSDDLENKGKIYKSKKD